MCMMMKQVHHQCQGNPQDNQSDFKPVDIMVFVAFKNNHG